MSDQEETIDKIASTIHDKQEPQPQINIGQQTYLKVKYQYHTLNPMFGYDTRENQYYLSQLLCTETSKFRTQTLQNRSKRMTNSYKMRFKGISRTLLAFVAFIFLQNHFILETRAEGSKIERPKITYNSQDDIEQTQKQAPISKAICSGDSTDNAGVMSLTYTFSVDWEPVFSPENIIFNIEESLIEALSSRLLSCNQRYRIRRHLQQRRIAQTETENISTRDTGIVAIDATPEDKISELSTCEPKDASNKCAVVHGTISLFLEEGADLDLVRYITRSAILESMEDANIVQKTKGVTHLSYLGPSFKKPDSLLSNNQTSDTKKHNTMRTTTILIILGSCSSITVLGTICFVIRTQRNVHKNMRPVYDFDESQGQASGKKEWINTSQTLTEVGDSVNHSIEEEEWDDDQEGLSVIMEATHEASTGGGSRSQVSNTGWTTDEDSTMSYNQSSVVSGFSNLSTFT